MKKIFRKLINKLLIIKNNIFTKNHLDFYSTINLNTKLQGRNVIHKKANISNSNIGYATYVGKNSNLSNSKIGKFCSISSNVNVVIGNHPTKEFVSIHPSFYSTQKQSGFTFVENNKYNEYRKTQEGYSVEIGNDVWIGTNVLIIEGVKIADGSIIGAGAIVTKDTKPYSINVGIPAKCIDFRFNNKQIQFLEKIKWWDKPISWIKNNSKYFTNIEELINHEKQ